MRHSITLLGVFLTMSFWCVPEAQSFQVLVSLNTYKKSSVDNALSRVNELKCDGVWIITQNSDFSDQEWKAILNKLGGTQITEDNPEQHKSYLDYVRITGKAPDGSFCYNETGGLPGGTQLTDTQIEDQYASHGKKPLICLTRSYGGDWRKETDRCLRNPKVGGMCMEYVKKALLENINAPAAGIRAILRQDRPVYLLLHAGDDGWTLEENRKIIENLNQWCPEAMRRNDVFLVYQDYHGNGDVWFGKEGVSEAIDQACNMPNYSGSRNGRANSPPTSNEQDTHSTRTSWVTELQRSVTMKSSIITSLVILAVLLLGTWGVQYVKK